MSTAIKSRARDARIITLGCRLNAYESEVMGAHARAAGLEDAVIVNTCAVTSEAVRQARQGIRKARRHDPEAKIIVTGCAAQVDPAMFAAMPEVDHVLGNGEKMRARSWHMGPETARVQVSDIQDERTARHFAVKAPGGRARAVIEVQNGCDHRCTFCIIPFGRGPSRSVPADDVVAQVRQLANGGVKEVVLSGVDLTSWGGDLPGAPQLGDLVRAILKGAPKLPRLRLSSIDAIEMDPLLFALMRDEERLTPYLHLSLQAGDDMILKRMKRRHSRAEAVALCARLKAARPDIAFGADLIAGFPTETEEMFENTLALVEDCALSYLHVFPYSARPGTPAARMPAVPGVVVKARAARLRQAGAETLRRHLERHKGTTAEALVEKDGFGRLADFSPISLADGAACAGALVTVRITGHDGKMLHGQAL